MGGIEAFASSVIIRGELASRQVLAIDLLDTQMDTALLKMIWVSLS